MTGGSPRVLAALLILVLLSGCGPDGAPRRPEATAAAPAASPREGVAKKGDDPWAIVWRRTRGSGSEVVKIGAGVIAMGPVDGEARRYLFAEPERSREVLVFTRTYAPFQLRADGGVLELRGRGAVRPGPADRRMVYEWARQVAAEAGGVEPGSGYGLVLTWQRVSGSDCDEVAVYLSGEVRAGRCGAQNPISGRLAPGPLAWLYGRFDRLASFQAAAEAGAVGLSPRLVFAGGGRATASSEDRRELEGFGAALARELSPRRPPPAQPAATGADARNRKRGAAAEGTPAPASPAGPRLLLPPQRALPLPEVILPDDRLPPPPPVPPREERQGSEPRPVRP